MSKKINQQVDKADLANALRANLIKRKKQLRARQQCEAEVEKFSSSDQVEVISLVLNDQCTPVSNNIDKI